MSVVFTAASIFLFLFAFGLFSAWVLALLSGSLFHEDAPGLSFVRILLGIFGFLTCCAVFLGAYAAWRYAP